MQKYEYMLYTLLVSVGQVQEEINKMAQGGWRLVAVGDNGVHYFERLLTPPYAVDTPKGTVILGLAEVLDDAVDSRILTRRSADTILTEARNADAEIARLRELVIRAQNDMMAIESRCLTKNREKARSLEFVPILNIAAKWTATPLK
jgi:hypothetical protein